MKNCFLCILLLTLSMQVTANPQNIEVFLITCGPGTETYSIYGHSAIRIIDHKNNTDLVYNWGVFDFSTPNFVWKFAKGRLDYMLGVYPYEKFLRDYFFEERWVISQKMNLDDSELILMLGLIAENLRPENIRYRYDFFYDNCSTRIRDIIEKATGNDLIYPPDELKKPPSFRALIRSYQKDYAWMNFGIDLLMGYPADRKASLRDRMFLPLEMKDALSGSVIRKDNLMIPLLQNPVTELDFADPVVKTGFFVSPPFVFSMMLIIIIILAGMFRNPGFNFYLDVFVFFILSVLALMMIFFNFFTDHQQLRWNLNTVWLNPFLILCLASILMNRKGFVWFRIAFFLALIFLMYPLFFPQHSNNAFVPLIMILLLRCSVRGGFTWNPLAKVHLT